MTKVIARAFSRRAFLCAVLCFSLLALPSAANARPTRERPGRIIQSAATHEAPIATTANDSGPGSLRQALADAQDGDTITFDIPPSAPPEPAVIALTSGELVVDKNITISGPGANVLTITRDQNASAFRIFNVTAGHTVTLAGLTISSGLAQGGFPANAGGGIYNDHATLTVSGCVISGNFAETGGGIYNDAHAGAASLIIVNSSVSDNSGDFFGGGVASSAAKGNATVTVNNSTFKTNTATFGGGGIFNYGVSGVAILNVNNSTFSGNTTGNPINDGSGGGIFNDGHEGNATLKVSNSTFRSNIALRGGGGAICNTGAGANLRIGNTVVAKSGSEGNFANIYAGVATSAGYNLSDDSSGGFLNAASDQLSTDPMLGPLKDNGGPTLTHAPLVNSPTIDQGKRTTIPALATDFDERGFARPINDPLVPDAPGGDGSDIGAVELAVGLHPSSAASSKTHGGAGIFAINLPLPGLGIECRSGGANSDYQLIVSFPQPVTFSSAGVTSGIGMIATLLSEPHFFANGSVGTQLTIDLTGVGDDQIITVALFDVDDGTKHSDVGVHMGVLVGDVNGGGNVSSSDVSQVKLQSGQLVGTENFRTDIVANGVINASDISAAKSKSGTGLP